MKKLLAILMVLVISVMAVPVLVSADTAYLTLALDNKNPDTWQGISDNRSGSLYYNTSGPKFDYSFTASGLEPNVAYSLIYYANPYPGNFPGALLGTAVADGVGNLSIPAFGGINLNMNLPTAPDSNMVVPHNVPPDNYATLYGAKIWLVPSICYNADTKSVIVWSPERFLFETDLINYTDTDASTEGKVVSLITTIVEPTPVVGLSVTPASLDFGSVMVGHDSIELPITITNTGTVPIKVTTIVSTGFYTDCMWLALAGGTYGKANIWTYSIIAPSTPLTIYAKVNPTAAYGTVVTGSITFMAEYIP